jgi:hypothetical protein
MQWTRNSEIGVFYRQKNACNQAPQKHALRVHLKFVAYYESLEDDRGILIGSDTILPIRGRIV